MTRTGLPMPVARNSTSPIKPVEPVSEPEQEPEPEPRKYKFLLSGLNKNVCDDIQ